MSDPARPRLDGPFEAAILELGQRIRQEVREALQGVAAGVQARDSVTEAVGAGAGDITFAIDVIAERTVDQWLETSAGLGPLSVFTEDTGWRHRLGDGSVGGDGEAGYGFHHGGPRLALDPIDGTRNVMHDLRSAWVVASLAGPGPDQPRFQDLSFGLLVEIPDARAGRGRELWARRGSGRAYGRDAELVEGGGRAPWRELRADDDPRLDRGYFPFFGFHPSCRAEAQALAFDVFERLARSARERGLELDLSTVFDDQYISSGGQLALLALGTYRAIIDPRALLGRLTGNATQTAKPYDLAGAVLIAQEAGCVVTSPDGSSLDFPMDAVTPVDFAGFHNAATAAAMMPHLVAASLARGRDLGDVEAP